MKKNYSSQFYKLDEIKVQYLKGKKLSQFFQSLMIIYNLNVSYFLMIWFIFKICIKTQPENKRKQPQLWLAKGNYF